MLAVNEGVDSDVLEGATDSNANTHASRRRYRERSILEAMSGAAPVVKIRAVYCIPGVAEVSRRVAAP